MPILYPQRRTVKAAHKIQEDKASWEAPAMIYYLNHPH